MQAMWEYAQKIKIPDEIIKKVLQKDLKNQCRN